MPSKLWGNGGVLPGKDYSEKRKTPHPALAQHRQTGGGLDGKDELLTPGPLSFPKILALSGSIKVLQFGVLDGEDES